MTISPSGAGSSTPKTSGPETPIEVPMWILCWMLDQLGGHIVLNSHEVIVASEKVVIENPIVEAFQEVDPFHLHIRVVYKDEHK